jgi:hypothetical protein
VSESIWYITDSPYTQIVDESESYLETGQDNPEAYE